MRRALASFCIVLAFCLPIHAATADLLQEKSALPLPVQERLSELAGSLLAVIPAIMSSNMEPGQKAQISQALMDLAKYEIEQKYAAKKSFWSQFFDITLKIVTLGASIFTTIRVTT